MGGDWRGADDIDHLDIPDRLFPSREENTADIGVVIDHVGDDRVGQRPVDDDPLAGFCLNVGDDQSRGIPQRSGASVAAVADSHRRHIPLEMFCKTEDSFTLLPHCISLSILLFDFSSSLLLSLRSEITTWHPDPNKMVF